jgi:hypothetical protein
MNKPTNQQSTAGTDTPSSIERAFACPYPPCVCFRFCLARKSARDKPRKEVLGGAGVAVEHIQATPVGEIIDR